MSGKRSRSDYEPRSDSAVNDSRHLIGTPLPRGDSQLRDDGSYVPVWKQEARDDRGRKRFHGAFTGGFSAGYFNTVGSKEGWTPSSFVSSRSNRASQGGNHPQSQYEQRPEDFMDEEDLADMAESRILTTNAEFSGLGESRIHNSPNESVFGLLRQGDSGDNVGHQLLQKMGWRIGQGIGPKVRRRARLADYDGQAVTSGVQFHLFAPEKTEIVLFSPKNDKHGLGYNQTITKIGAEMAEHSGGESEEDGSLSLLAGVRNRTAARTKPRAPRIARPSATLNSALPGIGTGVLDDSGSDEDPYSMGPKISHARKSGLAKKSKPKGQAGSNKTVRIRPQLSSSDPRPTLGPDGLPPLPGFVLSSAAVSAQLVCEPVIVPTDWVPARTRKEKGDGGNSETAASVIPSLSQMHPDARAEILGEEKLPGKSVFDFITPAARARLVATTGRNDLPTARGEKGPTGSLSNCQTSQTDPKAREPSFASDSATSVRQLLLEVLPRLDLSTAKSALERVRSPSGGWTPYSDDPAKRSRYIAFLEHHIHRGGQDGEFRPDEVDIPKPLFEAAKTALNSTQDGQVFSCEMGEFTQSARVFRQVEGTMADRFRSSGSTTSKDRLPGNVLTEDPALTAARMGMYGPTTTRTVSLFFPTRLLCKRFGVPYPDHPSRANEDDGVDIPGENGALGLVMDGRARNDDRQATGQALPDRVERDGRSSLAALPRVENDQGAIAESANPVLARDRPADSLFRAVFGSDEDEDEDEDG